jgi:hypothetical protein
VSEGVSGLQALTARAAPAARAANRSWAECIMGVVRFNLPARRGKGESAQS